MTMGDTRAPVDRDGPVIRRSIGKAPVSRPARTQKISDHYGIAEVDGATLFDKWLLWSAALYFFWVIR